jgi:tRNA threonylcarbamoyladenosine biosynthesis protein TsaE
VSVVRRHNAARNAGDARALVLRSASPDVTHTLGERLGRLLQSGDVVLLTGNLGAGKTAFTQGIAQGLGVVGPVSSPTFTLLKEYTGRIPLYHFDLYRIEDPAELDALGFDDYFFGDGVAVVEWAERGEDERAMPWPEDALRVAIVRAGPQERVLRLSAAGPRGEALLAGLRQPSDATADGGEEAR